ncbi:phosphatidylserine/phosphatidylglycerophosphate/cardiolipin synthase family protein, partial [Bdellovibrionota bacterium]
VTSLKIKIVENSENPEERTVLQDQLEKLYLDAEKSGLPGGVVPLEYWGGYERAMQDLRRCVKNEMIVRLPFQYDGTAVVVNYLNEGINSDEESRARVEAAKSGKDRGILHNKIVTVDGRRVFGGTANFTETGLGSGKNVNISLDIQNSKITRTFDKEFFEMWELSDTGTYDKRGNSIPFPIGKLHIDKSVNTERYFVFDDGTEVRIFFSPTDDGEHRGIIPFFYSAQPGDNFRILIFGASGIELLRAMQYALANGANLTIIFDLSSGGGLLKAKYGNLCDKRLPYRVPGVKRGRLELFLDPWMKKLQHAKAASITRDGKAVALIIGSQNWTESGNDKNDENMMVIRKMGSQKLKGITGFLINWLMMREQIQTQGIPVPPLTLQIIMKSDVNLLPILEFIER